jgi:hypothetical protein
MEKYSMEGGEIKFVPMKLTETYFAESGEVDTVLPDDLLHEFRKTRETMTRRSCGRMDELFWRCMADDANIQSKCLEIENDQRLTRIGDIQGSEAMNGSCDKNLPFNGDFGRLLKTCPRLY